MERSFKIPHLFIFIVALVVSSCTLPAHRSPYAAGYVERGIASWYGEDFHGKPTSSGEIYNMYDLTAAHKLMPLGTVAKITNLENDQSVVVKINDRGPFVDGRIIDLSYSAAREIGMAEKGLSRVEIKVLKWGESLTDFTVQVGSFELEENAIRLKEKLNRRYQDVYIKTFGTKDKQFYRVRVGSTKDIKRAEYLAEKLSEEGFSYFITRKD
ncbi:MAG: septal ring lytic transglycosylase RlpA family protein [Nitrospirae bacterium]|nr:septal ring lytic transglycosylase RlpA family protein [Nitrospirota bacterium]